MGSWCFVQSFMNCRVGIVWICFCVVVTHVGTLSLQSDGSSFTSLRGSSPVR